MLLACNMLKCGGFFGSDDKYVPGVKFIIGAILHQCYTKGYLFVLPS